MAVRIDIPGIGEVVAENAASEETLRQLVDAVNKSNNSTTGSAGAAVKATKDLAKETLTTAKGIKGAGAGAVAMAMAADSAMQSLKNFGTTAAAVTAKFLTDYAKIADEPIKTGRDLLNTGIDLVADFGGGLAKSIPVFGPFIGGVIDATAALAKMANNMFADQLEKNIKALQLYAKSGVSFSGGMQQMQDLATSAGLGIKDFSEIVSKNKTELNKLGLAGGEAAIRLAKGMGASVTTIGKSGQNLRNEMFKMGYQYEEQGEIFTSFMANMQVAGKLRTMSDVDIAKGTREYAANLKVISDITGQDAKKLVEKARSEATRGALLVKLQGDQKDAFIKANSVLAKAGPDAQQALTEMLTFGKVMDPKLAAQQELVKMATDVAVQVQTGNKDIVNSSTASLVQLNKDLTEGRGAEFGGILDKALLARVGGTPSEIAQSRNQLMSNLQGMFDPEAGEKSAAAAEDQASKVNKLGDVTAGLYDATKKQQVLIESKLNPNLETYVGYLEKANNAVIGTVNKILGDGSTEKPFATPGTPGFPQLSQNPMIPPVSGPGIKKFAGGGRLGAGQIGIAGEAGPELIGGPATVLSNASYGKLMEALDAMKEKKGVRFADNGFQRGVSIDSNIVGTTESYAEILNKRTSGFEGLSDIDLQREIQSRPEYADMQRAKNAMDDEMGMGRSETNELLKEMVRTMRDNNNLTSGILQHSM